MKQLTIRGFDAKTERAIRDLARREGISLNQAVLRLLGEGIRATSGTRRLGDSLDDFIGRWSKSDASRFMESIEDLEEIDEEMWR
jgi:hypothetical protein